ncbi:MAG: hypothetical protein RSE41_01965 [Clostridia bacterium]
MIYFSCRLVTKHKYIDTELFIPSLLSIITWCISFFSIYILIKKNINTEITNFISSIIFRSDNILNYNILLPSILIVFITIIIQAFILLTINIDYKKQLNNIIYKTKKATSKNNNFDITNNETNATNETNLSVIKESFILNYINSFVICLFVFSLTFFLTAIFYITGITLSNIIF